MRDALTDDEAERLLAAPTSILHGNGKGYRHALRDQNVLRRALATGATVDELVAGPLAVGLSRRAVQRLVGRYARRAGIAREVTVSTLRTTFARRHFERYRSIPQLMLALGLKSPAAAAGYLEQEFIGGPEPAATTSASRGAA